MSNVKGLEIPKIAFTLGDDSFIEDNVAAKEIAASGNKQAFGRHKFKVKVAVPDTIIHGSDLDLVSYIENALKSGLAAKEKKVSFATTPTQGEEHMSFYQKSGGTSVIDEVTGTTMYEAITNAIADLHEDFRENAKVVMKYADYVTMLKELSNGSMDLYQAQPEKIIGKPVIFSDSATTPIVGDFNYCVLNYDGEPIYDADKDVDKGNYIWVLTAWIDQHRLLNSAFRLAVVEEDETNE
jgi:HK97 family phage major capsid protein